ncbi:MAG: hypothetical protein DRP00_04200, partial [Candidatus Aenigmatarchaeota archaeon]
MSLENYKRIKAIIKNYGLTQRFQHEDLTGVLMVRGEALSPIHIGSGKILLELEEIVEIIKKSKDPLKNKKILNSLKRGVARASDCVYYGEKPAIPGSTLKGLCRSRLQLLAVAKNDKTSFLLHPSKSPPRKPIPKGVSGWRHFRIWAPATWEDRVLKPGVYSADMNLFGAAGLASKVFFGNLMGENWKISKLE